MTARIAHTPAPQNISGEEVRSMLKTMSKVLGAIADGTITVDGQRVQQSSNGHAYRPTIKELRAQGGRGLVLDDASATQGETVQLVPRVRTLPPKPRVVYELGVPEDARIDTTGLPAAGIAILKYLSVHGEAPIATFMKELGLKRSTIANVLTMLRSRELVKSRSVEEK